MEVLIKESRFPDTVIWAFADAANLSEFYYPRTLYTELQGICELALNTVNMSENEQADRAAGERASANDKAVRLRKMHKELRTRLKASDDSLGAQLRQEPLELNGSPA
jgi:hypothetical protein